MQHFAFALTPEGDLPRRPHQPKMSRRRDPNSGKPDHRVLIACVAVGAATCALLGLVGSVTVP